MDSEQSLDDIALPKIGKNYHVSRLTDAIESGKYTGMRFNRPVCLIPQNPSTIGTYYVYAGAEPQDDSNAVPIPNGNAVTLDGAGLWYVKQTSGSPQKFLAIDGGGSGNASAILSALGLVSTVVNVAQIGGTAQSGVNVSGKFATLTPVAPGAVANVTNVSGLKLAARASRQFLYFHATNFQGGCNRVTVWFSTPVIDKRGIVLFPDDWRCFGALDNIFGSAVYAITDQGTADLYFSEGV